MCPQGVKHVHELEVAASFCFVTFDAGFAAWEGQASAEQPGQKDGVCSSHDALLTGR